MADDGSAQSTTVWPMPKFYFQVKADGKQVKNPVLAKGSEAGTKGSNRCGQTK